MTGAEFDGVDLDLLADYVGGALDGTPDQERVATLVSEDPAWRAAFEALEPGMIAVEAALGEFEAEPMPSELAARLDAMFRAPVVEAGDPDSSSTGVPAKVVDLDEVRRSRARRWVAPVGVAAALLAFAGFGVSQLSGMGMTDNAAQSTAAEGGVAEDAAPMMAGIPADNIISSGTDYTAGTLAQASGGRSQEAILSEGSEPATAKAGGIDPLARLSDPSGLFNCLDVITQANGGGRIAVELVDYARFEGAPAMIVRFSAANGTWVWAVGPKCGTPGAGADTVEQLPVR
ncbi:hypothetical protein [Actinoplanes sp. NPDC049802]|uniref:hypothetical protein n=1 Tax=Actinoplanes sp. NPDC049802 TaxID=3154742 RepID=UPI0033CA7487